MKFGKFKESNYKMQVRTFFGNPEVEVFSSKFDETESYIASSNSDGSIKVFDLKHEKLLWNLSGYSTS